MRNKKFIASLFVFLLASIMLVGCSKTTTESAPQEPSEVVTEETAETTEPAEVEEPATLTTLRVGGLKGPTSMGLLFLQEKAAAGEAKGSYEFQMVTAADELLTKMIQGELDIALIPANVASVLYNKTEGKVAVIDINTLGVLYMVSGNSDIASVEDLKGKTVYLTGKGTTPDYVLQYLLSGNGIAEGEVTLEYRSEATEVAALLAENPDAVGLLPQPFVTVACAQNEALQVVMDLNEQWAALQEKGMVTGVTVVRKEVLEADKASVDTFLEEHKSSAESINADVEKGAALVVAAEIIGKEPLAKKAIPQCNITYLDGEEMKQALSAYLQVLFEQDPKAVGGALPAEDFYYQP